MCCTLKDQLSSGTSYLAISSCLNLFRVDSHLSHFEYICIFCHVVTEWTESGVFENLFMSGYVL